MELFHACFDNGLLVRATGDIIALSPPLIVEKPQIDEMFGRIAELLGAIDEPASGKVTDTRVPLPSSLSMSSWPWWRSLMCLTIARPRPVPPTERLRASSTR